MSSQVIQWYPGHMAKTRRIIEENLKNVDVIVELLDARIPHSSRNPDIVKIKADKPSVILFNKASLADPAQTLKWFDLYSDENTLCIATDCVTGEGLAKIAPAIKKVCSEKLARYADKGMNGRKLKAMVLGIPNVGKSSLVNKLSNASKAKVEDRPGVTLNKQWINTNSGFDLLDMPGILWPKFNDKKVGENLAITGAVKDTVVDIEELATVLCKRLLKYYPELLFDRYRLNKEEVMHINEDIALLEMIGRKRGFLISGGSIDTERTSITLLDEYRGGKIGRITLDYLSDRNSNNA